MTPFERAILRPLCALCLVALSAPTTSLLQPAALAARGAAPPAIAFSGWVEGATADGAHAVQISVRKDATGAQMVHLSIEVGLRGRQRLAPAPMSGSSSYEFILPASDLIVSALGATLDTRHDLGVYGRITARWRYLAPPTAVSGSWPCSSETISGQRAAAVVVATVALTFPCDGAVRGSLRGTNLPVFLGQVVPSPTTGGDVALTDGLMLTVDTSEGAHQTSLSVDGPSDALPVLQVNETTIYSTTAGLVYATHTATDTMTVGSLSFDLASTRVAALHYRGVLGSADLTFRVQSHALTTYDPAGSYCDGQLPTGGHNPQPFVTTFQSPTVGGWATLSACATMSATFTQAPATLSVYSAAGLPGAFAVRHVSPANGARGVPIASAIAVTFNQPLASRTDISFSTIKQPPPLYTLRADVIRLGVKGALFAAVGQPTYNPATRTATWRLGAPLRPHALYTLRVSASSLLGGSVTWTTYFTTGG